MADVVICYSRDGEGVAGRLAGALAAEGFSLWSEERAAGPIADRVEEVRAAIVVWSDAARASDWTRAEANYARGQKKLVQASADGGPPPMPFDAKTVASLADWSGEPDHPGWRKIRAEIEALARPVRTTPAPAPVRRRPPPPPPPKRRGGLTAALVLIGLAAVFATLPWVRSGPPFGRPPAPVVLPKSVTEPPPAELPPLFPPSVAVQSQNEVAPAIDPDPVETLDEEAMETEPAETRPEPRTETRPQPRTETLPGPPAKARPTPRASGPRINRRNSENMRLFCERAGRGTPECRRFRRQARNR